MKIDSRVHRGTALYSPGGWVLRLIPWGACTGQWGTNKRVCVGRLALSMEWWGQGWTRRKVPQFSLWWYPKR